jgi:hypothetical protein
MAPRQSKPAIRRSYNDTDKWLAYNHWLSTGRFTKTTARECHLSVSTLRAWVKAWKWDETANKALNPPTKPTDEELESVSPDERIIEEKRALERMALDRLREVIPKTNSADQLGRIAKWLGEDIARSEGFTDGPNNVTLNVRLEAAKDAGDKMLTSVQKMIADATVRHDHIIDVESQEIASESEEVPNE